MQTNEDEAMSQMSVLIAEDDPTLLEMLSNKFERGGFRVLSAPDGKTAQTLLWEHHPNVVILDWLMPKLDGLSLCRMIKAEPVLSGTKVIILTARGRESEITTARAACPDLLLIKPVSLRSLLAQVKELSKVALSSTHQENSNSMPMEEKNV